MSVLLPCILSGDLAGSRREWEAAGDGGESLPIHGIGTLQKRLGAKRASQAEDEVNFVPACQQHLSDNSEVIPPKCRDISISFGLEPSYFKFSTRVRE